MSCVFLVELVGLFVCTNSVLLSLPLTRKGLVTAVCASFQGMPVWEYPSVSGPQIQDTVLGGCITKGPLRSASALLVHYSRICFERGEDWQELIVWWYTFICLQIMCSYYFALWRPVMPPASSPGLWLVLRLLLVQCVVWLYHPCTMDIMFLVLLLLLIGY